MINMTDAVRRKVKRSDLIADQIKDWIVKNDKKPGDRLPREHELMALFAASKGTIREALKVLEVHGLIRITTGPAGGAVLMAVPYERCLESVYSYLYFREISTEQVYALRKVLEPELAASLVNRVSEDEIEELLVLAKRSHPDEGGDWEARRNIELAFHDRLAELCPSPLLGMMCRLLNDVLRSMVLPKYARSHNVDLEETITDSHVALVRAIQRADAKKARKIMAEHMSDVQHHGHALEPPVKRNLTLQPSHTF